MLWLYKISLFIGNQYLGFKSKGASYLTQFRGKKNTHIHRVVERRGNKSNIKQEHVRI